MDLQRVLTRSGSMFFFLDKLSIKDHFLVISKGNKRE